MKTILDIKSSSIIKKSLLLLAVALPLVQGCGEEFEPERGGKVIRFTASSNWQNSLDTKTAYSGDITDGVERIDWVVGDKILIWSDKASTAESHDHSIDYKVTEETSSSGSKISGATIEPSAQANGLQWGEGAHKFLCLYPSPTENSKIGFASSTPTDRRINMTIPGTQSYTKDGNTLKPDMKYAYMYASAATAASDAAVTLSFKPMFTAFQFTVDSGEAPDLTITSFSIQSKTKAMSGSCLAVLPVSSTGTGVAIYDDFPTTPSDEQKKISVTFGGTDLKITKGTPLTFTVFALPRDYDDLSVSFTTKSGDVKTLKLTKEEGGVQTGIEFKAGHKYNIRGIGIPGEWVYVIDTIDDPITVSYLGTLSDPYTPTYTPKSLKSEFKSYRYKYLPESVGSSNYTQQQIQPLKFKFEYSSDCTSWEQMSGDSFPSATWLKIYSDGGFDGGSSGENLTYNVDQQTMTTSGTIELAESSSERTDLSTYNVATGKIVDMSTANCYVVDSKGTFKFPAVYGNGILHGKVNMPAFHRQRPAGGAVGDNYLEWFKDHADEDIMQPYIAEQPSVVAEPGDFDAVLVWENVDGLIKPTSVGVEGSGKNMYIKFEVPGVSHQGNAMIALRKGGKIVWSWHIWCYSDKSTYSTGARPRALTKAIATPNGYKLSPVNLGWCDLSDYFAERKGYIRVVQEGRDPSAPVLVWQKEMNIQFGAQPHYVWGRKDPIRGFEKLSNQNHPFYYKGDYEEGSNSYYNSTYNLCVIDSKNTLGWYIQNPYVFCIADRNEWCSTSYRNLWNSSYIGQAENVTIEVTKTIYDPCPVGYKVPSDAAFSDMIGNINAVSEQPIIDLPEEDYGNFWRYYANGTPSDSSDDIYFPATGYRISKRGSGEPVGSVTAGLWWVGGMGYYWTSHSFTSSVSNAKVFYFGQNTKGAFGDYTRAWGRSIRPMVDPQAVFDVDGGVTGGHDIDRLDPGDLGDWTTTTP